MSPVSDRDVLNSIPRTGETQADFRQRMTLLQAEAVERRQQELGELRSRLHAPADRIRIWERLHQLPLPRSATHRLLTVIATNTGLSLDEVRAEQHARAAAKAAVPAG
ncbi:MAG TPA: hypothetical protein VHZ53_16375 [Steroidobacteraceae bacterium]|jgi:hypothetical protein|nr:hypothetical protein [Steroidobacteraceae bacterium]